MTENDKKPADPGKPQKPEPAGGTPGGSNPPKEGD